MFFSGVKTFAALAATAHTVFAVPLVATRTAGCSRESLLAAADAYIAAQTAGKPDALSSRLAPNWEYEENNVRIAVDKGVLSKAIQIDHIRTIADTIACATFTEVVAANNPGAPYVIGTQIRHDPASLNITLIDSVATTTNSWLFNATRTLEYVLKEKPLWTPIPEAKRDSRDHIKAAGDAYMDMWSNGTAARAVPWGRPCNRLEGGAYVGTGSPNDSCEAGIPSNTNQAPNTRRRYVIDETMGSVNILCVWEHMMMAADSHEFRLENAKVRFIHTMTVCPGNQVCRL